jgi:DNA polymerase
MSGEPREELRRITAGLKRYIERERAAGTGDLLLDGAAAARAKKGVKREPAPKPVAVAPAPTPAVAPKQTTAWPVPPPAPPVTLDPVAAVASIVSESGVDLFGKSTATPRRPSLDDVPDIALPPVHDPLNSREIGERAVFEADSLPVLGTIAGEINGCTKCGLCETRTRAVPGVGSARTGIVFVGEAPGADEDAQGEPFVGRAGQLLTRIIAAMDEAKLIPGVPLNRETVYICNVLKCRPPENRNPLPHEIETCSPYLRRQLVALKPRIICCLGKFAAELLVGVKGTIGGLRGKVYRYQGAKLIVTYHPAACLRNPGYKRPVWEDMQLMAREYLA